VSTGVGSGLPGFLPLDSRLFMLAAQRFAGASRQISIASGKQKIDSRAALCAWSDNAILGFAGTLIDGSGGTRTRTSGVTGRSWRLRAERG
jgi:hypothetical protein